MAARISSFCPGAKAAGTHKDGASVRSRQGLRWLIARDRPESDATCPAKHGYLPSEVGKPTPQQPVYLAHGERAVLVAMNKGILLTNN